MAITVDWPNYIINIPKADLTLVQATPTEIYELDINFLRLKLKDLEDSEAGMFFPATHSHNPPVTVGGVTLAMVVEILEPYTITFEDGQYAVNLFGANSNVGDRVNVNQVSVRSANSAGLISSAEIEYGSFGGGVHIDVLDGTAGTIYPTGTPRQPVNNLPDALLIAERRGFTDFYVEGDLNILTENVSGYTFTGQSANKTTIYIAGSASVTDCEFYDCILTGTLDGSSQATRCAVSNLIYVNGGLTECFIMDTIIMGGTTPLYMINCVSGKQGGDPIVIDMGGDAGELSIRNFSGALKIQNKTGPDSSTIDMSQGSIIIDSTVTNGTIACRGIATLENNSTGSAIVLEDVLNPKYVNNALYDMGCVHIDVNSSYSGTLFPTGTMLRPVNNVADARIIADNVGLTAYAFHGTLIITAVHDNWTFKGKSSILSDVVVLTGVSTANCKFENCTITGTLNGVNQQYERCFINAVSGIQGLTLDCAFNGTIQLNPSSQLLCSNASTAQSVVFDINGAGSLLQIATTNSGTFNIANAGAGSVVQASLSNMGSVTIDNTNSPGSVIMVSGIGEVTDNSTAVVVNNTVNLRNVETDTTQLRLDTLSIISLAETLLKYDANRTKINKTAKTLTVYDDDGVTPIKVFNLKDSTGTPSVDEVTERIPQ